MIQDREIKMNALFHQFHECRDPRCAICEGGLGYCTVCGAGEGQLLAFCPGRKLSEETLDACYQGNVRDLTFARMGRKLGWCLVGATDAETQKQSLAWAKAYHALSENIGGNHDEDKVLVSWNDARGRAHAEVLSLIDRAIAAEEGK